MEKQLKNSDALKFIFAGNSTVTFLNTETQNRFTFRVKKAKDKDKLLFFVSVLSGPDQYSYLGTFAKGRYSHGKKSCVDAVAQSAKVFPYVIAKLREGTLPEQVQIWHEGKCGKCGRQLTVPESIDSGIGPECMKSLSKEEKRDMALSKILG